MNTQPNNDKINKQINEQTIYYGKQYWLLTNINDSTNEQTNAKE